MTLTLSPTAALTYEDCPRQYWYVYVLKARPRITSANLVFGQSVAEVLEAFLRAQLQGHSLALAERFTALWTERTAQQALEYASTWSAVELLATGQRLVDLFPSVWEQQGLMPLLDRQGEPLLERRLAVPLAPDVLFRGRLDCIVVDAEARVLVLDFKTPAQATDPAFSAQADQLTGYQLLVEQHAESLGLEAIDGVGFMDLIKRKAGGKGKGPEVSAPHLAPRRSAEAVQAYRDKLLWLAEDIRQGRFPRRPRMAHNTPCALCAFKNHCLHGEAEDLLLPPPAPAVTV